ncbi:MAG: hypothetical protein HKN19_03525 [Halioglobus sp.]|nr:hypothetical protein [Halioglobus sp.]
MKTQRFSHLPSALLASFLLVFGLAAGAVGGELEKKLAIFSAGEPGRADASQWAEQISAARSLEYVGLSDPALFNLIEANLLDTYMIADRQAVDYISWMAKSLGYSGQSRYLATLERVAAEAPNKKVRKHANLAIDALPKYAEWNPVISSRSAWNSEKSDAVNRYANMIKSGDLELQRMAAKRMSFEKLFDGWLLALLDEQVRAHGGDNTDDKLFVDSIAWMTKILAASGVNDYRPTVEWVAADASSKKLRAHASKYIASYY